MQYAYKISPKRKSLTIVIVNNEDFRRCITHSNEYINISDVILTMNLKRFDQNNRVCSCNIQRIFI
jgi:hypothetical protein